MTDPHRYVIVATAAINYLGVDYASGKVVNVIVWDGETPYTPPAHTRLQQSDTLSIGDEA